jgi:uncharacterized membrane protein YbhN (UPF0104 family)
VSAIRAFGRGVLRVAAGPNKPGRPVWARVVMRCAFVFACGALVYTILAFPGGPETIPRYFVKIGWFWFVVVAMEAFGTFLDGIAIQRFAAPENQNLKLRHTLLAQLSGRAINIVTPTGNLGEVVKMSVLTEHVSQSRAVSTILLYNIVRFIIELMFVALAAPLCALLVPMPDGLRALILVGGGICMILSLGLFVLVRKGMLTTVARVLLRIRIIKRARYEKWEANLRAIDDKLRLVSGARGRDRVIGTIAIVLSQLTSMTLSLSILVALGESLSLGFVGAYVVGGFVIYNLSIFVPMGLGLSEGGWYSLLTMMGEGPARVAAGLMMVYARRTTLVLYAAVGLFMIAASSTVKRARERQAERTAKPVLVEAVLEIAVPPVDPTNAPAA